MFHRTPKTPDLTRAEMERRARQVARVQHLTDPLGAMGQRDTGARVRRESAARRALFVSTLTILSGGVGMFAVTAWPGSADGASGAVSTPWVPAPATATSSVGMQTAAGVVVEEIPGGIDPATGRQVVIRIIAPLTPTATVITGAAGVIQPTSVVEQGASSGGGSAAPAAGSAAGGSAPAGSQPAAEPASQPAAAPTRKPRTRSSR